MPTPTDDYAEAAARVRAEVWRDSWGPHLAERHRREWPALWAALDKLAELVDADTPANGTEPMF